MVAGRAGGIPRLLPDVVGVRLVDSTDECARAILGLLSDRAAARRLAAAGWEAPAAPAIATNSI